MNNQLDYTKRIITNSLEEIKNEYVDAGFTGNRLVRRSADERLNYLYFVRDEINAQIKATKAAAKKVQA